MPELNLSPVRPPSQWLTKNDAPEQKITPHTEPSPPYPRCLFPLAQTVAKPLHKKAITNVIVILNVSAPVLLCPLMYRLPVSLNNLSNSIEVALEVALEVAQPT